MIDWRFQGGEMRPHKVEWPEEVGFVDDQIHALGYRHCCFLGGVTRQFEGEVSTRVYSAAPGEDETRDRYLVDLSLGEATEMVFIPDLPNLIEFLRLMEPVMALSLKTNEAGYLQTHLDEHQDKHVPWCLHCQRRRPVKLPRD